MFSLPSFSSITSAITNKINTFIGNRYMQLNARSMSLILKKHLNLNHSNGLRDKDNNLISGNQCEKNNTLFMQVDTKQFQTTFTGDIFISDTLNDSSRGANMTLSDGLSKLKENLNGTSCKVYIPIGQGMEYLGILSRGHYTLLELDIDKNGKLTKAKHTDSKGLCSALYSLKHIETILSEKFNDIKLEAIYTGEQGVTDNVNCGRFVAQRIIQNTNGNKISFEEMDSIFNKEEEEEEEEEEEGYIEIDMNQLKKGKIVSKQPIPMENNTNKSKLEDDNIDQSVDSILYDKGIKTFDLNERANCSKKSTDKCKSTLKKVDCADMHTDEDSILGGFEVIEDTDENADTFIPFSDNFEIV